ncbi:hypothetical protein M3795_25075 [Ralstonia pickettii]|uniref:hypothetical protein n=1 Tax=Ralstonia pickettii TaxID=329 RepID=UPI00203FFF67|nr:hypothetical protein [Ralstonia pickettii]MCM3583746.1 hypothetical protein [Ralstonia pickettii]
MLTTEQLSRTKKLDKLLKDMPEGVEIIVGLGNVSVMEAGFYKRELSGSDVDMMSAGGQVITDEALYQFAVDMQRVIPNSESI